MEQKDYLELSEDGKTVIKCKEGYKGAMVIPEGVTRIGDNAFANCFSLTSIEIPNNVTVIGNGAFWFAGLTSIVIPDSVTVIGNDVFSSCTSLKEIIVEKGNPNYCSKDGVLYSKDMSILVAVPCGKESIVLPDSVIKIGYSALAGCENLTSIEIPNSVTEIEDEAFIDCSNLTSIEIPDSVTVIGNKAFWGCYGLTSIKIPDSVIVIRDSAFLWCSSLTEMHFKHMTPIVFSDLAFWQLDISNITLYVPKGAGEAYRNSEYYKDFKEIIEEA